MQDVVATIRHGSRLGALRRGGIETVGRVTSKDGLVHGKLLDYSSLWPLR